jgi:hypothetical protein
LIPAAFIAAFEYFRRTSVPAVRRCCRSAAQAQALQRKLRGRWKHRLKARHEAAQFSLDARAQMEKAAQEQEEEMN